MDAAELGYKRTPYNVTAKERPRILLASLVIFFYL
jgi:hypothetical protein